jgi:hypothetical protein
MSSSFPTTIGVIPQPIFTTANKGGIRVYYLLLQSSGQYYRLEGGTQRVLTLDGLVL